MGLDALDVSSWGSAAGWFTSFSPFAHNILNKVFKVAPCELQGKHLGKSLIFLIRENGRRKHQLFLSSDQALRSAMEKRLRAHANHLLVGHPAIPKLSL